MGDMAVGRGRADAVFGKSAQPKSEQSLSARFINFLSSIFGGGSSTPITVLLPMPQATKNVLAKTLAQTTLKPSTHPSRTVEMSGTTFDHTIDRNDSQKRMDALADTAKDVLGGANDAQKAVAKNLIDIAKGNVPGEKDAEGKEKTPAQKTKDLLDNPICNAMIMQFSLGEFSPENMAFYNAVPASFGADQIGQAKAVYEQFVGRSADSQVNLGSGRAENIRAALESGDLGRISTEFQAAKKEIVRLMSADTVGRFLASPKSEIQ
jgi:hypothetical protein